MYNNGMKKFFGFIISRMVIIGLGVFIQVAWFAGLIFLLKRTGTYASILIDVLAVAFAIFVCNRRANASYNLCWVFLILAFPFIGLVVFALNGQFGAMKKNVRRLTRLYDDMHRFMPGDTAALTSIEKDSPQIGTIFRYLSRSGGYPVYAGTKTAYYKRGEDMARAMLNEMKKAEKYIFAEFFIIDEGEFLSEFLDIMEEKARAGVDVRLIYDDMGTIRKLPGRFFKRINERGIKCVVFNRFHPKASALTTANNRDHRKILSIDGKVGFTGGLNIADEYINKIQPYGYWKDTGVRLEGDAVTTLTNLFLASWGYVNDEDIDLSAYRAEPAFSGEDKAAPCDGYVSPYAGTPFLPENVAENVYLGMINRATRYVYIFTPYLALDGEMMTALTSAAKSGVDVKIIMPGIPDKKSIYLLTQSYFEELMEAGVHIYLYKPGFIHAKSVVCDDEIAAIGSINLDYRSLYLHYENSVLFYGSSVVSAVRGDFLSTLAECGEDSVEALKKRTKGLGIIKALLRVVAPML